MNELIACGLIVEFNPFHYGHAYFIKEAKKISKADVMIAIMSPSFMQRGEPAIVNKRIRTEIALEYGIDLVIELPSIYAIQSANHFAYGALKILNELQISSLVFGSENNNINKLVHAAKISLTDEYQSLVKKYVKDNVRYANACNQAFNDLNISSVKDSNDILGLAYVQEIEKYNYPIKPLTIQRTNEFLSTEITETFISATALRKLIINNEPTNNYTPLSFSKIVDEEMLFPFLKYQLTILTNQQIKDIHGFDEGLEHLFLKNIKRANSIKEFVDLCTSKRYPSTRIKRAITYLCLNHSKEDNKNIEANYIRVLGFNNKGRDYLKQIKKETNYPIATTFSQLKQLASFETKVSHFYELLSQESNLDFEKIILK